MANLAMFQNQKSDASLVFAPAPLDAGIIPVWVSTDPDATYVLTVAADGLTASVVATGVLSNPNNAPGSISVSATLADGTVLKASGIVTITQAPPPETMDLVFSIPVNQ